MNKIKSNSNIFEQVVISHLNVIKDIEEIKSNNKILTIQIQKLDNINKKLIFHFNLLILLSIFLLLINLLLIFYII
jgi:hypothetical protein